MNTFPSFHDIHRAASRSFGSSGEQSNREESQSPFKVYIQTKPRVQIDDEALKDNSPGIQLRFKENKIETKDLRNDLNEMFHFDHLLNQNSSLNETFSKVAIPLIKNTLLGYNNSIFVYDHSRFGKNQTAGFYGNTLNQDSESLVANSLKYFFQYFELVNKTQGNNYRWKLSISLVQIYLNNVVDLLDPNKSLLNIPEREDSIQADKIQSAKIKVENIEQAFSLLNDGLFIKSDLHQSLNRISEKSHHILTLEVIQEFQNPKNTQIIKSGSQFSIVDLAYLLEKGPPNETLTDSEMLENKYLKSTLQGLRKQLHISLESSQTHGNSILLKYLQNHFGGENRKISLIATIPSLNENSQEALSTLKFACKRYNDRNFKVTEKSANTQRSQNGIEETMNTLRATNTTEADFPIEKKKIFEKTGDTELIKCLVNTMVDIKKLFLDKILDTFYIREKFVAKMIEDLQRNLEDNKNNVEKLDAKFYLKQNKLLKEIQKKISKLSN